MLKMAHRKISLACGIHCCPNFLFFFTRSASLYCEEYVYVCVCVYTHTHTSDCVEIVFDLLLLLNNTMSETLLHKLRVGQSVDCVFVTGALTW